MANENEFSVTSSPLDEVEVICDVCLTRASLKRGGYNNNTFIVKCECGVFEMMPKNYKFEVGAKNRVLLATVLKRSDRKSGSYTSGDPSRNRLLIELDTGVLLENDEEVDSFIWPTDIGRKPFGELERRSTQLMDLYLKFKHLEPSPASEKDSDE